MPHDDEQNDDPATSLPDSIRGEYERFGVQGYYEQFGAQYRNPHEPILQIVLGRIVIEWALDLSHVLDLACGSGEVTLALRSLGCKSIEGIDPYTGDAYRERTGQIAEKLTFEQIGSGMIADRKYSLMVCSFALHLVEDSRLPAIAYQLSLIAPALLILSPHKRPTIKPEWGWSLTQSSTIDRVHARLYKSTIFAANH